MATATKTAATSAPQTFTALLDHEDEGSGSTGFFEVPAEVIVKCGGFTTIRRIAALGETHHTHLVPRMTQPAICTAANLHVTAGLRDATRPQEFTGSPAHRRERAAARAPQGAAPLH